MSVPTLDALLDRLSTDIPFKPSMVEYQHTCLICGHQQEVISYSCFSCDGSGQDYRYEEGHMINLQAEQVESLRTAAQSEQLDNYQILLQADLIFLESLEEPRCADQIEHIALILKWCQSLTPKLIEDVTEVASAFARLEDQRRMISKIREGRRSGDADDA